MGFVKGTSFGPSPSSQWHAKGPGAIENQAKSAGVPMRQFEQANASRQDQTGSRSRLALMLANRRKGIR